MHRYRELAAKASNPSGRAAIIAYLNEKLPPLWTEDYERMAGSSSELLTITFRDRHNPEFFLNTMFDHASAASGDMGNEDRVVAVWGLSRSEPAGSRDKRRMAGFLKGRWSDAYPGYDRGHFFAHTMGGGTDINLFPQLASVNRGGLWRQLEQCAAKHPGTYCFIHPLYAGRSWKPIGLEYGLFTLPPGPFKFIGETFNN